MKRITQTFLLLFVPFAIWAQNGVTLSGKVTNLNGEPLPGANVVLTDINKGVTTDFEGNYIIKDILSGMHKVEVSFIGFETIAKSITLNQSQTMNFQLSEGIMLGEMVVTAQKREQSVKEIPTAVTSLSGAFLAETGNTEIQDLADYIPGFQVQVQSPNNPGFVVRGITSDDNASNIEPRVSVFQDGVSISKSPAAVVEMFDLERIEVLKGPQGTLFGRGAQTGAVHIIQNKPKNITEGGVEVGFGNYKYRHFELYYNTPLVNDKLFFRVAGIIKKRNGYTENLSGGTLNGKDTKALRMALRWLASEATNFTLIGNYQHDTPPGVGFKSGTYAPLGGDISPFTFADLEQGDNLGINRKVGGVTLLTEHQINDNLTLNAITAYRTYDSTEKLDADGTVSPALFMANHNMGDQISQELRLNFNIGDRFEGFAGGNFFYENGSQRVDWYANEKSFMSLLSPLAEGTINNMLTGVNQFNQTVANLGGFTYPIIQFNALPLVNNGVAVLPNTAGDLLSYPLLPYASIQPYLGFLTAEQQAGINQIYGIMGMPLAESHAEYYKNYGKALAYEFFADGTYKITDKLKATAGVRLTFETIESGYEAGGEANVTMGIFRSAGTNLLFMPSEKLTHKENFTSWVGRFALNYSITDDWEVYGTVSKGRRPNVIQYNMKPKNDGTFISTYVPEVLNEEIVYSYEAGLKGLTLGSRLYFDVAGFYYKYSNFQTSAVDLQSLQIVTKDAGNATAYGAETSLKFQATKAFSVFGNYSYIHAEFDKADSDGQAQEYAGNTFRLTPKHSFSLGFNYTKDINENLQYFLRPSFAFKSKVFFEEDNLETESQGDYGLLNYRTGLTFPKQKINVAFFMNNAFDKDYIIDAGNTGKSFGIPTYIAGMPRTYGVELSLKF